MYLRYSALLLPSVNQLYLALGSSVVLLKAHLFEEARQSILLARVDNPFSPFG